jgi:hypothetical protein
MWIVSLWRIIRHAFVVMLALVLTTTLAAGKSGTKCWRSAGSAQVQAPPPVPPASGAVPVTAAQAPIWKTITIGQYKGANAIRAAIDAAPCPIAKGDQADEIIGRPAFPFSRTKLDVDLVVVSVAELGFGPDGASLRDIYARAGTFGLELCPAEIGPILRLNYLDQPLGDFLHVAMRPVATYAGELVDFTLGNGGSALLLIGGDARPDLVLTGAVRVILMRPRADAVASGVVPNSENALVKRLIRSAAAANQARIGFRAVAGATEPAHEVRIAQSTRDRGERVQMLRIRLGRQQQQEHDINRLAIDRLERDRSFGAGENAERLFHRRDARMRDCDAAAHPG